MGEVMPLVVSLPADDALGVGPEELSMNLPMRGISSMAQLRREIARQGSVLIGCDIEEFELVRTAHPTFSAAPPQGDEGDARYSAGRARARACTMAAHGCERRPVTCARRACGV